MASEVTTFQGSEPAQPDWTGELTVTLPTRPPDRLHIGSFYIGVCDLEPQDATDGHAVSIGCGYTCGHSDFYVSVDDKRVLIVNSHPLLEALVRAALAEAAQEDPS